MTRRLLLAGEGPDELGKWFRESPYQHAARRGDEVPGILEALLRKLDLAPWEVTDAVIWRSRRVPLFRRGERRAPETRRVLGLSALAKDCGADGVVFVRDRDGDEDREADIEAAFEQARSLGLDTLLAGGVAVEEIEAWILAFLGDRGAESHTRPKEKLAERHGLRTREQKVTVIEGGDLDGSCAHARSLRRFRDRVREALGKAPPEEA